MKLNSIRLFNRLNYELSSAHDREKPASKPGLPLRLGFRQSKAIFATTCNAICHSLLHLTTFSITFSQFFIPCVIRSFCLWNDVVSCSRREWKQKLYLPDLKGYVNIFWKTMLIFEVFGTKILCHPPFCFIIRSN